MTVRSASRYVFPLLAGLLLSAGLMAQEKPGEGLPPPDINDPGVAAPAAQAPVTDAPVEARSSDVIPHDQEPPEVNIRRQGDDIVQEYSHGGQIYMIRVIPARGVPQTYRDIDGDGRLNLEPGQAPVAPVYYTLYEWGKPPPKPESD